MSYSFLLIGVSKYNSEEIDDLPYCQNDLKQFKNTLKSSLDISDDKIFCLGEDPEESSRANVLRFIKNADSIVEEEDTLIIYFTGHGSSIANKGYLLTYDTEPDIISDTSIPIDRLKKELKEVDAKNKVLFVDSCFSGANFGKSNASSEAFLSKLDDLINQGWTIFSSCKGDEVSWFYDDEKVSVFTHYLIEGFKGKALRDKKTKKLRFEDLTRYVTRNVAAWSLKNRSKSQTPTIKSERVGSFYFELKKILEEESDEDSESNKAMEITLQMSYKSPSGYYRRRDPMLDSGAVLNATLRTTTGLRSDGDKVWESYSDKRRKEKMDTKFDNIIKKFNARLLNHLEPSKIKADSREKIILPFGKIETSFEDFSFELTFHTKVKPDDDDLEKLLFEIDDQDFIQWESVSYKFDNQFNIDKLRNIVVNKNYKIEEYEPFKKITKVNITPEDDSPFYMTFVNKEDKCHIRISEKAGLRENFLELIPATEMIEIFKESFKN